MTTRKSKRRANAFLKAAMLVEEKRCGCCTVICEAHPDNHDWRECDLSKDEFAAMFAPERAKAYWWRAPPADIGPRVLALCFMAAIAESGM